MENFWNNETLEILNSMVKEYNWKKHWNTTEEIPLPYKEAVEKEKKNLDAFTCDNTVTLDNGTYLTNHHGKYKSGLTLLHETKGFIWLRMDYKELNVEYASLEYITGEFFTSKKGTKCFRIKHDGNQLLLRDNWGGSFAKYWGGALRNLPTQYYVRASSNGGGNGYDYAVIFKGTKRVIKEDDI